MRKQPNKRLGLLRMILDFERAGTNDVYLPVLDDLTLEKYGLTVYDNVIITNAHKMGLVEFVDENKSFIRLTEKGKKYLQSYILIA